MNTVRSSPLWKLVQYNLPNSIFFIWSSCAMRLVTNYSYHHYQRCIGTTRLAFGLAPVVGIRVQVEKKKVSNELNIDFSLIYLSFSDLDNWRNTVLLLISICLYSLLVTYSPKMCFYRSLIWKKYFFNKTFTAMKV